MDEESLRENLKTALDLWRFQIDSYWSRNSYFVTFHSAIMAAIWQVSKNAATMLPLRRLAAQCICYVGILLAVVWMINNIRVHQYIMYWWKRACAIEQAFNTPESARLLLDLGARGTSRSRRGQNQIWMNSLPILFLLVWLLIRFVCF